MTLKEKFDLENGNSTEVKRLINSLVLLSLQSPQLVRVLDFQFRIHPTHQVFLILLWFHILCSQTVCITYVT